MLKPRILLFFSNLLFTLLHSESWDDEWEALGSPLKITLIGHTSTTGNLAKMKVLGHRWGAGPESPHSFWSSQVVSMLLPRPYSESKNLGPDCPVLLAPSQAQYDSKSLF